MAAPKVIVMPVPVAVPISAFASDDVISPIEALALEAS